MTYDPSQHKTLELWLNAVCRVTDFVLQTVFVVGVILIALFLLRY